MASACPALANPAAEAYSSGRFYRYAMVYALCFVRFGLAKFWVILVVQQQSTSDSVDMS